MRKFICRSGFVITLAVAAAFLFQGCYVKSGDKVIIGKEDTSVPGSPLEWGCVLKIDRGLSPLDSDSILFENQDGQPKRFSRSAPGIAKIKVGKCYQWKLQIGNLLAPLEVAPDTVREIEPVISHGLKSSSTGDTGSKPGISLRGRHAARSDLWVLHVRPHTQPMHQHGPVA